MQHFVSLILVLSVFVCIMQNTVMVSAQDSSMAPSSVPSATPSVNPSGGSAAPSSAPSTVPSSFPIVSSTASALSFKALSGLWLVLNNTTNADETSYYNNASCYRVSYQYLSDETLVYVDQFNVGSASGPLTIGDWGVILKIPPTGDAEDLNLTRVNVYPYFTVSVNVVEVGPLNSAGLYSWILIKEIDSPNVTDMTLEAASLYVREPSYFKNGSHASELQQIANLNILSISSLMNPLQFEGCNFTRSLWDIEN